MIHYDTQHVVMMLCIPPQNSDDVWPDLAAATNGNPSDDVSNNAMMIAAIAIIHRLTDDMVATIIG